MITVLAQPSSLPARVSIDVGDSFFSPASVRIAAGATVVRRQRGERELLHNVVGDGFNSGDMNPIPRCEHSFTSGVGTDTFARTTSPRA